MWTAKFFSVPLIGYGCYSIFKRTPIEAWADDEISIHDETLFPEFTIDLSN